MKPEEMLGRAVKPLGGKLPGYAPKRSRKAEQLAARCAREGQERKRASKLLQVSRAGLLQIIKASGGSAAAAEDGEAIEILEAWKNLATPALEARERKMPRRKLMM